MSRFIQIHTLAFYPPSNPNRDDLGRPKSAKIGGVDRLRISSQCLKRAWRTSDSFQKDLGQYLGIRTKLGKTLLAELRNRGVEEKEAISWANEIISYIGTGKKLKEKKEKLSDEQLVHLSPEEKKLFLDLIESLALEKRGPKDEELLFLRKEQQSVDIALFGRMLAGASECSIEAAAQVSHAFSVHPVAIEDDFFSAIDEWDKRSLGAGHIDQAAFASSLFYIYVCINRDLLKKNLMGNEELTAQTISSFIEAIAKVTPGGKQNSFAHQGYASYMLVEKGKQQPRSLAVSFLKPIEGRDYELESIRALEDRRERLESAYGPSADDFRIMNLSKNEGSLSSLISFAKS